MKREIERKFLVRLDRFPPGARADGETIEQGYLSFAPSVRVRRIDGRRGALTIKGAGTIARDEFEYDIPGDDAKLLLAMCAATLTKVRHRAKVGVHVWEVDEFTGAHEGLWLAEIELSREDEAFEKPAWAGDEVSHDARYTNAALARAGRAP